MTTFLRLLETDPGQKATTMSDLIVCWRSGSDPNGIFQAEPSSFSQVPGSPFAYWVSERVRKMFSELPPFEGEGRTAKVGLQTSDDFRFVRAWWEVDAGTLGKKWFPFAKGGSYSPFYSDLHLVVNWGTGDEMRAFDRAVIRNPGFYFRSGLTWPLRSQLGLSFRSVGPGAIFGHKGPMAFPSDDPLLTPLLALMNSTPFARLVGLQMAFGSYEVGVVQRTPLPELREPVANLLAALASAAWRRKRDIDTASFTSHSFALPALLQVKGLTLVSRADAWATRLLDTESDLVRIQAEIDDIAFGLYGIDGEDRLQMEEGFGSLGLSQEGANKDADDEELTDQAGAADPVTLTEGLLEWVLGVALGRFDVRLATGERQPPTDPAAFDPLPVCSPGMVRDSWGLPATETPAGYPLKVPPHGILVDDLGHPWDVVSRMEAVFDVVAREHAQAWILEAESIVGRDLRDWLRRYGLERHLRWYSLSRRKAPLFWHLAPSSRAYGIWLYSPVASRDSLYRILNDYVTPRMKRAERRLMELWQEAGDRPTGRQRQDLTSQESLVEELQAFRGEVARAAPLWAPHRCDGIILNCAVLWRLFGHHRVWQNGCKSKWGELAQGKYDWSGWAMRLWPERALKACAKDRSVAIAHGLEDTLWETDDDQKWMPRSDAGEKITALMAERRSPAIEAALDEFMRSV